MKKYTTVKISGVITQIAATTDIKGYAAGVLQIFFPDDNVIENWSDEESAAWVKNNNDRMQKICNFLNSNNL